MNDQTRSATEPELVLWARDVRVTGSQGVAVDGLDVDVVAGGIGVLQGPDGSGKTSALLALSGRMVTDGGDIEVAGHRLPRGRRAVQRSVSLAEVTGVNALDDALTVSSHIAERLATHTLLPWATRRDVQAVMDRFTSALVAARGSGPARSARTEVDLDWFVGDLTGVERTLFGIVLALSGGPAVVAVDENGELRSREDRHAVATGVGYLMRTAVTPFAVLATSTEAVDGALLAEIAGIPPEWVSVAELGTRPMHATALPLREAEGPSPHGDGRSAPPVERQPAPLVEDVPFDDDAPPAEDAPIDEDAPLETEPPTHDEPPLPDEPAGPTSHRNADNDADADFDAPKATH